MLIRRPTRHDRRTTIPLAAEGPAAALPHSFTESTLIDYVRAQREELPKLSPETIHSRSAMLRRLFRVHFQVDMPLGPYRL